MLAFLKRCEFQMQRLLQTHLSGDVRSSPTSSKTLLNSTSLLKLWLPWGYEFSHENKTSYKMSACDMKMQCFGFGKLCFEKPGLSLGLAASVPLICDGDLGQANDEPLNSFMCGSFIRMTNWKGCRVTVKELHDQILQQCEEKDALLDLLISEQEYCCQVSHPHMLMLMAVSMSAGLDSTRLVYERVNVGSLYSLLHQKRDEFPLLQLVDLLSVVLQVCEVLMYLNGRSLVLRALSSHTVLIVHPGVAKVTGLGFMVPSMFSNYSEGTCPYSPPPVPVPLSLINWAAPEVIRCRACTGKADLYSVCALIQEIYTDAVPWGPMDPRCIRRSVEAGQALEIRSKNKRSGWNSWSALQCIPGWNTDINQAKEQDEAVYQNCRTAVHNEIQEHHLERIYTEEEKSTLDTDDLHWDISHHDNIPLMPITHHAPLSEPSCSNYIDTDKDLAISSSISKHTGSIVLNLKVSEVLLQQAEQSLDNVEATRLSTPCFDEVDAVLKRVNMEKERSDSVWKAFGPPSKSYMPVHEWTFNADDEVSQYSSAQDESFESTSYPSSVQVCAHNLKYHSVKGEVSDAVALMAHGCFGKPLGAVGSSDSEDVEEQQLHLQDWQRHNIRHSVNSYPESETQESTDLEQLFKSFADILSDSEESTNYHTINQTFDVTNGVLEATSQTEDEGSSDTSAYTQTPLELSCVFYTPKHHLSKSTSSGVEHSQSLSSEDELDVTVEVCRPSTSPAEEKRVVENSLSEYQLAQEDSKEFEPITPVHRYFPTLSLSSVLWFICLISCLPDLAEIPDLSSISCSPAHPIPHSRGHPPCNSTPRSPKGHRTLQDVQIGSEPFPPLPSLSHTVCTESYDTACAGDSSNVSQSYTNASVSSVLQSPLNREMSKEETDSPSSGNAEVTTASSGARQTTETSQETSEEMEHPIDKNNDVDEEVGDNPSDSKHQESSEENVFEDEGISKRMEECKGENPCQIHDQHPDLNSADMESNANSQKSNESHSLDDTKR
ncbi:hypothetical protein PO909_022691 [Leuciscus waleckii]